MTFDPALRIQDKWAFGEYGEVNPSISDSSTFTFLTAEKMEEIFEHEIEGCFLYSRHLNPTGNYLASSLAAMEDCEAGIVTASGMAAISCALLQLCACNSEIVSSRTIYGGTYALLKNVFPKMCINTKFVNITDLDAVRKAVNMNTKVIYCETISNPLLEVADIAALREIADEYGIKLVIDNTFSPLIISPHRLGASVVVYSLTKYINGASDCVAGAILGEKSFIDSLRDVHSGFVMLLGPVLDSIHGASILKNMHTLDVRMKQHGKNALFLAEHFKKLGIKVFYPGLPQHPQHELMDTMLNPGYGYGGMVTIDAGTHELADKLMVRMQENQVGYFAVSLGYFKTLFSSPGSSTSSEIPKEEQDEMGMSEGLVRISVGLDSDIQNTYDRIVLSMKETGLLK